MQRILQYILPFELPKDFQQQLSELNFEEWDKPSRQIQISAIMLLTAFLYTVFVFIDKPWASESVQELMLKMHMLVIVPALLLLSYLANKKRFYSLLMPMLAIYPLISMSCHIYIASLLEDNSAFLTEAYLGVLWIFIVSGMTFRYALASASAVSLILIICGAYIINTPGGYALHIFWILCSFSFGFLGALVFDRSRKAIFLNQQDIHKQAITDPLTGVYNRNKFNQVITEETARSLRYDNTFGLLMIDIDHFKSVNDNYGHETGDQIIRETAQVLLGSIRKNDTLVRWGGEEFVVVALEVDERLIAALSEKLRSAIQDQIFPLVGNITVSIGSTLFTKLDSQDEILKRADKALYRAKGYGRNTCVNITSENK